MTTSNWFDDTPILGKLAPELAATKLREVGEEQAAAQLEEATVQEVTTLGKGPQRRWPFGDRAWQHTAHTFGHLAPAPPGSDMLPIQDAGNIPADETLKNGRIKITLDRLRVADYPGGSMHCVLFDFCAQSQVPGRVEHLHFTPLTASGRGSKPPFAAIPSLWG